MPSSADARQRRLFLEEVLSSMPQRRPCVVLDCSQLQVINADSMHLMLHCLEGALKRNGDVRLAALQPGMEPALDLAGLGRLFEHYPTVGDAIASFHQGLAVSEAPVAALASLQTAPAT